MRIAKITLQFNLKTFKKIIKNKLIIEILF